jgi:hypothetical protein
MTEYIIDTITIADTEVHIICKENGDGTLSTFITTDLEGGPVGLVVFVPGFNHYFIYFDELNGHLVFPNFGPNMYYYSLNWLQDTFTQNNAFLQDVFRNITEVARHTLNQLIDNYQDAVNDHYQQGLNQDDEDQNNEAQVDEAQVDEAQVDDDIIYDDINYDDNIIIQDDEQVYNEMINNVIQG